MSFGYDNAYDVPRYRIGEGLIAFCEYLNYSNCWYILHKILKLSDLMHSNLKEQWNSNILKFYVITHSA